MRKEKANVKENFLRVIQKDPFITAIIWNIMALGMGDLTDNGTLILIYENPKTQTKVIIDPGKPTLFIEDKAEKVSFNIHIDTAIKITTETYGKPTLLEVPKFGMSPNLLSALFNN